MMTICPSDKPLPAHWIAAALEYHERPNEPQQTDESRRRYPFELMAFRIGIYGVAAAHPAELRRLQKLSPQLFGEVRYALERLGLSGIDIRMLINGRGLSDIVPGWRAEARGP
jgi:hypothetical protein